LGVGGGEIVLGVVAFRFFVDDDVDAACVVVFVVVVVAASDEPGRGGGSADIALPDVCLENGFVTFRCGPWTGAHGRQM
jgi:hypothetical protein